MNELIKKFIKYATFDDEGNIDGIEEDAPNEAKDSYNEYNALIEEAKKNGVKI